MSARGDPPLELLIMQTSPSDEFGRARSDVRSRRPGSSSSLDELGPQDRCRMSRACSLRAASHDTTGSNLDLRIWPTARQYQREPRPTTCSTHTAPVASILTRAGAERVDSALRVLGFQRAFLLHLAARALHRAAAASRSEVVEAADASGSATDDLACTSLRSSPRLQRLYRDLPASLVRPRRKSVDAFRIARCVASGRRSPVRWSCSGDAAPMRCRRTRLT